MHPPDRGEDEFLAARPPAYVRKQRPLLREHVGRNILGVAMAEASTTALRNGKGGAAEDLERRHLFTRVIRRDLPTAPRSMGGT